MGHHSLPEAREKLADLIDRALAGEEVVILRDGHPVVEIKAVAPLAPSEGPSSEAMLAWLRRRRQGRGSSGEDATATLRHMRDEEWG